MLTPEQLPDTLRSLVSPHAQPSLIAPSETPSPEDAVDQSEAGAGASSFGSNPLMRMALQKAGYAPPTQPAQPNFGKQLGKQLDSTPVPAEPGGWAKSIVAGAQKVLAGVGDVDTEPTSQPTSPFGSFVEGLAKTQANRQNRQAKEQQVQFQQQRELTKEQQEQQKIDQDKLQSEAIIAYNNSQRIHTERLTHQLGDQEIENTIKADSDYRKELESDGAQEHYKDKTWEEIQQIMSGMKGHEPNHPITLVPIATGRRVVGQEINEKGDKTPTYATTYSLYDAPQQSKLTEEQAKRFNEAANPATPYQEGDLLYGHQINTLQTMWKSKKVDDAGIQKVLTDSLGEKQAGKILEEVTDDGFDQKFHDASVAAGGYNHPDKIADELGKKGVPNAEQVVASRYGGQAAVDSILKNNTAMQIEKDKAAAESKKDDKVQNTLEQEARNILVKPLASRSGGLGLEDQKVNQANHLSALANQYRSADGFNIPPAQYTELVLGLARLLSPTGVPTADVITNLQSKTAKGDLAGAMQYFNGVFGTKLPTGSTQEIIKNLLESIDRQGSVAEQNREGYMEYLRGLMPTNLDPDRLNKLEAKTLNAYKPVFGVVVNGVHFPDQATADKALAAWKAQGGK